MEAGYMINIGIIGNNFGKYHAQLYQKIDGFCVKQIYGRDSARLKQTAMEFGVETTQDIQAIITDPSIDLVDICLPTDLHCEWAIQALKHGKHVLCETPVASTLEEALLIQKASEQYNRNVFVDLFYKFSSAHSKAIALLENSALSKVMSVSMYNKTAAVWGNLDIDHNISDFHMHNLDFSCEVLGLPQKVNTNAMEFDKASLVSTVLYYDGQIATIESSSHLPEGSPFRIGFEIICDNGSIVYSGEYGNDNRERYTVYINGIQKDVELDPTDDYEMVLKHVYNCINNNRKSPYLDISCAIDSLKIRSAIQASYSTGQTITLQRT
jgi:predicted dehydrogenase